VEPWMGEAESSDGREQREQRGGGGLGGGAGGGGAGAAATKQVDLSELAAHVTSINSKLSRLHGTVEHRNRTRQQVAQAVEVRPGLTTSTWPFCAALGGLPQRDGRYAQ
jgi:hypothetical protein